MGARTCNRGALEFDSLPCTGFRLWQAYETGDIGTIERTKADLAFFADAVNYSNKSVDMYPFARANVLAKHYKHKFGPEGSQPLVDNAEGLSEDVLTRDHPAIYVGHIFFKVYNGVKERIYG